MKAYFLVPKKSNMAPGTERVRGAYRVVKTLYKGSKGESVKHGGGKTRWAAMQAVVEDSIQIMNVYECNGTTIFMWSKMKCSIQRGKVKLNGTFHLSPNENIRSIARMRKHSLFVLYNLYKDLSILI